jgi:hypothetical protein
MQYRNGREFFQEVIYEIDKEAGDHGNAEIDDEPSAAADDLSVGTIPPQDSNFVGFSGP